MLAWGLLRVGKVGRGGETGRGKAALQAGWPGERDGAGIWPFGQILTPVHGQHSPDPGC